MPRTATDVTPSSCLLYWFSKFDNSIQTQHTLLFLCLNSIVFWAITILLHNKNMCVHHKHTLPKAFNTHTLTFTAICWLFSFSSLSHSINVCIKSIRKSSKYYIVLHTPSRSLMPRLWHIVEAVCTYVYEKYLRIKSWKHMHFTLHNVHVFAIKLATLLIKWELLENCDFQ